jgi:hypothetical protein
MTEHIKSLDYPAEPHAMLESVVSSIVSAATQLPSLLKDVGQTRDMAKIVLV